MELLKNIVEIGFGLMYLIGAVFNSLYTWSHGDQFYGSFADNALLAPARRFVRDRVTPNQKLFTGLLILFELLAAIAILSRGQFVPAGLAAGGLFAFMAAFFSNKAGAIANILMAVLQIFLALSFS